MFLNEMIGLIPEQNILISGIINMNGRHALSLNTNFKVKTILYKPTYSKLIKEEGVDRWMYYVILNNFTTFVQLIDFLTSNYIISLESHNQNGFTMLIIIENKKSAFP